MQTTLTKLAEWVANVHGELVVLKELSAPATIDPVGMASAPIGITQEV